MSQLKQKLITIAPELEDYLNEVHLILEKNFDEKFKVDFLQLDLSDSKHLDTVIAEIHPFIQNLRTERTEDYENAYVVLKEDLLGISNLFITVAEESKEASWDMAGVYIEDMDEFMDKYSEKHTLDNVQEFEDNLLVLTTIDNINLEFSNIQFIEKFNDSVSFEDIDHSEEIQRLNNEKLQVLADFQNYKRRIETEREESGKMASKRFINGALEIVDDLKRALDHESEKEEKNFDALMDGAKMIQEKFKKFLLDQDLEEVKVEIGDKFDPNSMQALTTTPVDDEKKDNTVILIDQQGYKNKNNGQVYRPAKVIIGKYNN